MKYQLIDYDLIKIEDEDGVEYGYAKLDLLGDDGDRYYCDTPLFDPVWERGYYNFLAGTGKVVRILRELGSFDDTQLNQTIDSSYLWRQD